MPEDIVVDIEQDEIVINRLKWFGIWSMGSGESSAIALIDAGPLIQVDISSPEDPENVAVATLMIDTGASGTILQDHLVGLLRLPEAGRATMSLYSDQPEEVQKHQVDVSVPVRVDGLTRKFTLKGLKVAGVSKVPGTTKAEGLLGRDALHYFRFVYDGPTQDFWFEVPEEKPGPKRSL